MNSKEGRATIDKAIRERMPIQGVVEGKESMLIGDVHFTKEDAAELFGTDDFSKISERLISVPGDDPPPPGPRIEYQVKGTEEKFTVANLVSRPDGIGYGGSWRFDLGLDTEFESRLREVNKRRQSSQQPQQEESLSPREQKLLELRFGFGTGYSRTLEDVATEFKLSRTRIVQLEAKVIRKLRHPSRSRKLRDYLE